MRYESILDDHETVPAANTYEHADPRIKSFDLTRLAETLAGVQTLLAIARKALQSATSHEAALLEAAIDASIAFPTGVSQEVLAKLAAWHYGQRQPNQLWRPHLLDNAFYALTTGVTAGSPHAILIKGDQETYRLLDALTPELQKPDRGTLDTLVQSRLTEEVFITALRNTGSWHYIQNNTDQARRVARTLWEYLASKGDATAMINLGLLANESADLDGAHTWWERAADQRNPGALFLVGCLAHEAGDAETASTSWTNAARSGHTGAMFNLGFVAHELRDLDRARFWWTRAARRGDAAAMNSLGVLARKTGATESAQTWWARAARKGDTAAIFNLGLPHADVEDSVRWERAVEQWERAAGTGVAANHVDVPYKEAPLWSERAAQHRLIDATEALAELTESVAMNIDVRHLSRGGLPSSRG